MTGMMSMSFRVVLFAAVAGLGAFTAQSSVAGEESAFAEQEFPVEAEAIVRATAELFDSLERVEPAPAVRAPVIRAPKLARKASVVSKAGTDPLRRNGPLQHLTGYRIDWYPTDRFLGSVDFMGTWDGNRNLVCGYVIWDVSDASSIELDRVVANFVDLVDLKGASPAEVHETLLEANCAFGAIDANFAFFDPLG